MGASLSKNEFPVNGRTALITGGSQGMGLNVARQLAEKGASVIIVARDEARLKEGIKLISKGVTSPQTQRFHYISAGLVTAPECARVIAEATKWNGDTPPDIVWCCAGGCHPTPLVDTPPEQIQRMMDVNYFSAAYMAHAALNAWLRPALDASSGKPSETSSKEDIATQSTPQKPSSVSPPPLARHLIFTASFVSFYTFAGYTPYSPAKAALRSLSDSLSQEMSLYAGAHPAEPLIRIHTIFPATMPGAGLDAENAVKTHVTRMLEESDDVQSPEEVARRSIRGLEAGLELVPTTFLIRLVMCGVLGGSRRGGLFRGLVDTVLAWVVVVVMVFVRGDMDRRVKRFGRENGGSGMRRGGG